MAHLLLTAAVRNPTVRSSFRAPRETLLRYDRAALYETILQVLGFDRVSALRSGGRRFMEQAPGLAFWPGLTLSVVVWAINMFGDALRDLLDPRLKGGAGVDQRLRSELCEAEQHQPTIIDPSNAPGIVVSAHHRAPQTESAKDTR